MANEFCKNCGTELKGARFCPGCGAPASDEVAVQQNGYVSVPLGADPRQRSLADMEQMLHHFGQKKDQYDELDVVSAEVEERRKYAPTGWIGLAVAWFVISLFLNNPLLLGVGIIGCIVGAVLSVKKNSEKLAVVEARQLELCEELQEHFKAYGYCPVGYEYTNPSTLQVLYGIISGGRASNPADAINLYISDLHNKAMLDEATRAADAAVQTAKNSEKAAKSAKKAAGYASASFWFK